jgi:competence protein ComEA
MKLPEISRRQAIVVCVLALVVLVAAGKLLEARQPAVQKRAARVKLIGAASSSRGRLMIDVSGAVHRPGVYGLPAGSRVNDALRMAGGATRKAGLTLVNRAATLSDGQQVLVPEKVSAASAAVASSGSTATTATAPIHLNSATAEQLDELPGVGPATAQRIIDYRTTNGPFKTVDELDSVSGIGPAKLAELRDLVVP